MTTQKHKVSDPGRRLRRLNAAQKLKRAPLISLYSIAAISTSFNRSSIKSRPAPLPRRIFRPLRGVLSKQKNALVLLGEAADIDPDARRVKLRDGAVLDYDSLIVATGSKTSALYATPHLLSLGQP